MLLSKRDEDQLAQLIAAEREDPKRVKAIFDKAKEAGRSFVPVSEVVQPINRPLKNSPRFADEA